MPHTHKDPANLKMIGRMIDAAGRHVGERDPDILAELCGLRDNLERAIDRAVVGQRESGIYWSSIAEALGVTKEAVVQRYGPSSRRARRRAS